MSVSGKDSDSWSPAVAGVWEGGDGNRGDRIARVGALISDFSFFFFFAGIFLCFLRKKTMNKNEKRRRFWTGRSVFNLVLHV